MHKGKYQLPFTLITECRILSYRNKKNKPGSSVFDTSSHVTLHSSITDLVIEGRERSNESHISVLKVLFLSFMYYENQSTVSSQGEANCFLCL
jgi:hypothetical protein